MCYCCDGVSFAQISLPYHNTSTNNYIHANKAANLSMCSLHLLLEIAAMWLSHFASFRLKIRHTRKMLPFRKSIELNSNKENSNVSPLGCTLSIDIQSSQSFLPLMLSLIIKIQKKHDFFLFIFYMRHAQKYNRNKARIKILMWPGNCFNMLESEDKVCFCNDFYSN